MQIFEFSKSLNLASNQNKLPKNAKINPKFYYYNSILQVKKQSISNKLELFLIDFDELFPIKLSEFIKSMYIASNWKKLKQNFTYNGFFQIEKYSFKSK